MLCVGFHKMFPITTIIAITTKNFFFIQSHSFAKFRFVDNSLYHKSIHFSIYITQLTWKGTPPSNGLSRRSLFYSLSAPYDTDDGIPLSFRFFSISFTGSEEKYASLPSFIISSWHGLFPALSGMRASIMFTAIISGVMAALPPA